MDFKVVLLGFLCCVMASSDEGIGNGSKESSTQAEDDSDMYMESVEPDHKAAASNFEAGEWFPSFSSSYDPYGHPTSGHSRPVFHDIYHQQEGAYSQRNDPPVQQDLTYNHPKSSGYKPYVRQQQQEVQAEAQPQQQVKENAASILGDGNFGVIQGGTFYPEKAGYDSELGGGFDDFSSYFHNGHGRPSYYYPSNSKPKAKKQQQFENFRDFADINNPPQRQYSQYVVVYTNKNGTRTTVPSSDEQEDYDDAQLEPQGSDKALPIQIDAKRPKNILESLALLDQTETSVTDSDTTSEKNGMILTLLPAFDQGDIIEIPPEKKQSKSKTKLAKLLPEKKHESRLVQKAKDMKEPLLALS